jgi:hypothetical protein
VICGILISLLLAQAPGIAPDWDLKPQVEKSARRSSVFVRCWINCSRKWTAASAPAAYEKQYKVASLWLRANAATRLAVQPTKLTLAVETGRLGR